MVGADVKQTRCTTCDTEHEYKHAKVPRLRRKGDSPAALYAQVAAGAPKRVTAPPVDLAPASDGQADEPKGGEASIQAHDSSLPRGEQGNDAEVAMVSTPKGDLAAAGDGEDEEDVGPHHADDDEGPVHRPLIRASLPREGQPPAARPIPEFTIRHPGGRQNRFRPRYQRGGQPFQGDRSNGNGQGFGGQRNAGPRQGGAGRPPQGAMPSRQARRHGPGRKRSK